jgi:hypothetical protein
MKITVTKLQNIIKEELKRFLLESSEGPILSAEIEDTLLQQVRKLISEGKVLDIATLYNHFPNDPSYENTKNYILAHLNDFKDQLIYNESTDTIRTQANFAQTDFNQRILPDIRHSSQYGELFKICQLLQETITLSETTEEGPRFLLRVLRDPNFKKIHKDILPLNMSVPPAEETDALNTLRDFIMSTASVATYVIVQNSLDDLKAGGYKHYMKEEELDEAGEELDEAIVETFQTISNYFEEHEQSKSIHNWLGDNSPNFVEDLSDITEHKIKENIANYVLKEKEEMWADDGDAWEIFFGLIEKLSEDMGEEIVLRAMSRTLPAAGKYAATDPLEEEALEQQRKNLEEPLYSDN